MRCYLAAPCGGLLSPPLFFILQPIFFWKGTGPMRLKRQISRSKNRAQSRVRNKSARYRARLKAKDRKRKARAKRAL